MDFEDNQLLKKAYDFAEVSLAGAKRKSGELILDHCVRVAQILEKYKINDPITLSVALLHHSLSEGAATTSDIQKEFGGEIASMIEAFESLKILRTKVGMKEEFIENLRKMFLVLAKDLRVVLIKLADILDNLSTLEYISPEKQKEVANETLEIFAPLAERLGMSEMRGEMQDLAFPYLLPDEFVWVTRLAKGRIPTLEKEMLHIKSKTSQALLKEGITVSIQSRTKHLYSLYTKLIRPEIDGNLDKIYDLIALRVLVETTEDCYKTLDILQKIFKIHPEKISDYIAHPKPNGYQSIHLKLFGPKDNIFEVQIRTIRMHEAAEYGVAAHWNYSDKKSQGLSDEKISQGFATSAEKLDWVKSLSSWQEEITNNSEFLSTVKTDFFGERIFCFTPKGDVKDLPLGATPIDFAYTIHTNLGNQVVGAKVNGKIAPINTKLKNGDVVELMLTKDSHRKPNRDWLNFVVTSLARKKIKKFYF